MSKLDFKNGNSETTNFIQKNRIANNDIIITKIQELYQCNAGEAEKILDEYQSKFKHYQCPKCKNFSLALASNGLVDFVFDPYDIWDNEDKELENKGGFYELGIHAMICLECGFIDDLWSEYSEENRFFTSSSGPQKKRQEETNE